MTDPDPAPLGDDGEQTDIIAAIATNLAHLTNAVAALTANTGPEASTLRQPSPPPRPWCWLTMPHTRKADRLGELGDWLSQVLFAWPAAQRAIPPCWPRHWDVIEELSMLYCCWKTAYLWEGANAGDAAEYLDRWLPNALSRIEVRLRPCGQGHQPDGPRRNDVTTLTLVQEELRWL